MRGFLFLDLKRFSSKINPWGLWTIVVAIATVVGNQSEKGNMIPDSKLYQRAYSKFCYIRDRHENAADLAWLDYEQFKISVQHIFSVDPMRLFLVSALV
jgi:hypothetical protein